MWELLAILAEAELEATKERYEVARRDLIGKGALVGPPGWGYIVVGDKFNKSLAPDPALVPHLRGMIELAMRGDSYLSICRWLDAEGVLSSRGAKWSPSSVASVLHNPALMGRRYENGKVVMKFDSLLSAAEFAALQAEFDRRPKKRGPVATDTAMLTNVIRCAMCGGPMYRNNSRSPRKDGTFSVYTVYRCKGPDQAPSRCVNSIEAQDIDAWVNAWFMEDGTFAHTEIVETITVPGDDHADEIAELEADLRDLDFDAVDYAERHATLLAERARLRSLPSEPAQVTEHGTGRTVGDVWAALDDQQRRRFLIHGGINVFVMSNAKLRAMGDGRRQVSSGTAGRVMLPRRMVLPAWGDEKDMSSVVPRPGRATPPEREVVYVTGNPARIEGALSRLLD